MPFLRLFLLKFSHVAQLRFKNCSFNIHKNAYFCNGRKFSEKMRLKPASHLVLVRQLKQTVKAKADGKAKSRYSGKNPNTLVLACFTVSFNR